MNKKHNYNDKQIEKLINETIEEIEQIDLNESYSKHDISKELIRDIILLEGVDSFVFSDRKEGVSMILNNIKELNTNKDDNKVYARLDCLVHKIDSDGIHFTPENMDLNYYSIIPAYINRESKLVIEILFDFHHNNDFFNTVYTIKFEIIDNCLEALFIEENITKMKKWKEYSKNWVKQ